MSWAVRAGHDRLAEFETGLQKVFDTGAALGVCQFDKRLFAPGVLADLLRLHTGPTTTCCSETALLRIRRTFASRRDPGRGRDRRDVLGRPGPPAGRGGPDRLPAIFTSISTA